MEKIPATIGVDYMTKVMTLKDGTMYKANIWDTGK
jgi:hypothetical protein